MIPLLAAALVVQTKAADLPTPVPVTVSDEVRDWKGFKYLPEGPRTFGRAIPVVADWSGVKGEPLPNATTWRTKVVLLERIDRPHERGPEFLWPGHHAIQEPTAAWVKRALPQLRALVADATGGAVNMVFDVVEEPEPLTVDGDLGAVVRRYLTPRLNGGTYQSEDGVFRGPYQSVFVVHPAGGERVEPLEVQGAPVSVLGLPDLEGNEADGAIAAHMLEAWRGQALDRAAETGMAIDDGPGTPFDWLAIAQGPDVPTGTRLKSLGRTPPAIQPAIREYPEPWARGSRGTKTNVHLAKDAQRGSVLVVEEGGAYRGGGLVLPCVESKGIDPKATPIFAFWMKSDAKDPIVVRFRGVTLTPHGPADELAIRIGIDVPFAYDSAWHPVRLDLRSIQNPFEGVVIGPDHDARQRIKNTLGPIVASFSDFELTTETPDSRPSPESPSPTSPEPELRARWAATAGPGEERRRLLRDPIDAVKANAVASAFARPDPAGEPMLVEDALFTFEPTVFTPALRALARAKTTAATAAIRQALRIAAAERARGLAAEILAESGDPTLAPTFVGLNQARSREARMEAIQALSRLPGSEAAVLRLSYLAQDDPEIKLAATLTADANDDYQARKLLWSAVNEPSDAVRLESLRRLSSSKVLAFRTEGLKGIHDDSVGVRVGLLESWTATPDTWTLPTVRAALSDREPRVRAAAVRALAANPAAVDPKDVPFSDPDPRVQAAFLDLAAKRNVAVPEDVRARLRKSPDARVRALAG